MYMKFLALTAAVAIAACTAHEVSGPSTEVSYDGFTYDVIRKGEFASVVLLGAHVTPDPLLHERNLLRAIRDTTGCELVNVKLRTARATAHLVC